MIFLCDMYLLLGSPRTRHPPRAVRRASAVAAAGCCLLSPKRGLLSLCPGNLVLRLTCLLFVFEEFVVLMRLQVLLVDWFGQGVWQIGLLATSDDDAA